MQVFMYHDSILKFTTEPNPQTLFSLKLAAEKNIQHIFLLIQYRIFASVLKRSKKKKMPKVQESLDSARSMFAPSTKANPIKYFQIPIKRNSPKQTSITHDEKESNRKKMRTKHAYNIFGMNKKFKHHKNIIGKLNFHVNFIFPVSIQLCCLTPNFYHEIFMRCFYH